MISLAKSESRFEFTHWVNAELGVFFNISLILQGFIIFCNFLFADQGGYAVEDKDGIENSCGLISELICHENSRGVSTDRIVLAGFSQGGAIALYMGLRYPERFAGIMALSTYLPRMDSASEEDCAVNRDTSFLYLHGSMDTMVSISVVERSRQILTELGYHVQAKDYPIAHSVSQEEIADIGNWLIERYDENGG